MVKSREPLETLHEKNSPLSLAELLLANAKRIMHITKLDWNIYVHDAKVRPVSGHSKRVTRHSLGRTRALSTSHKPVTKPLCLPQYIMRILLFPWPVGILTLITVGGAGYYIGLSSSHRSDAVARLQQSGNTEPVSDEDVFVPSNSFSEDSEKVDFDDNDSALADRFGAYREDCKMVRFLALRSDWRHLPFYFGLEMKMPVILRRMCEVIYVRTKTIYIILLLLRVFFTKNACYV